MVICPHCGFEAKTARGLAAHQRAKHPPGLIVAVRDGGRAEILRQLLESLSKDFEATDDLRVKRALSHEIRDVAAELDKLPRKDGDVVDEIAARRQRRRAAASDR